MKAAQPFMLIVVQIGNTKRATEGCAMVDHDLQGKLDDSSGDDMPQFQGA